jgi:hypothetical protein
MSGGSLNAVSVIYAPLTRFGVDIEPLQVVVKVHRARAQIAT